MVFFTVIFNFNFADCTIFVFLVRKVRDRGAKEVQWSENGTRSICRETDAPCCMLQLQLQSFALKQLFSEESCSVVGLSEKMSFQLISELSATVER